MSEELREIETAFYGAMQRGDADAMAQLMADDCTYIHSFGSRDTRDSYIERVRAGFFVYRPCARPCRVSTCCAPPVSARPTPST